MLNRKFGWTNVEVPVIGQGTWLIEGSSSSGVRRQKPRQAIEALRLGLDLGMTHIDTAEMYGNGTAEELVAEAIKGRRDEVFLVSKVLPTNASYEGTLRACKRSLSRLKTDWLDLYLVHWPSDFYPIKETMRAMEKLVDDGLVRFIGVSNFDVSELKEAEQALSKHNIACDQVQYNLGYRGIERHLLPYCTNRQIAIVGYSPFGHGNFPYSTTSSQQQQQQGQKELERISKLHNHTPRQVALNYLTRDYNVFSIPKAANPQHVKENAGGVGWNLTEDDISSINRAFPITQNEDNDTELEMI